MSAYPSATLERYVLPRPPTVDGVATVQSPITTRLERLANNGVSGGVSIVSGMGMFISGFYSIASGMALTSFISIGAGVIFFPSLVAAILKSDRKLALWKRRVKAAEDVLLKWISDELGAKAFYVHDRDYNRDTLVGFVEVGAPGQIDFGIVGGGRWHLWRDEQDGPISTNYRPAITQRVVGTTKKILAGKSRLPQRVGVDLLDGTARDALRRGSALLDSLPQMDLTTEQLHRVQRAGEIFGEALGLAGQAAGMPSDTRGRTLENVSAAIVDAADDLAGVRVEVDRQTAKAAAALASYTATVTGRQRL